MAAVVRTGSCINCGGGWATTRPGPLPARCPPCREAFERHRYVVLEQERRVRNRAARLATAVTPGWQPRCMTQAEFDDWSAAAQRVVMLQVGSTLPSVCLDCPSHWAAQQRRLHLCDGAPGARRVGRAWARHGVAVAPGVVARRLVVLGPAGVV